MAYSARSLSTNLLQQAISQPAHGFVVGDVVRFNGVIYLLAQANSLVNASSVGIVSYVSDANTFYVTQAGYVSQLAVLKVPGQQYYLSPTTPGALTTVRPTTVGQYIVPLFISDTTSSGYYFNNAPEAVSTLFVWNVATVNQVMVPNNGYIINGLGTLTLTLPAVCPQGALIEIGGSSVNGWICAQNAGQTIHMGNVDTTPGAGGSVSSSNRYDAIRLICNIANTDFTWLSGIGNLTIV